MVTINGLSLQNQCIPFAVALQRLCRTTADRNAVALATAMQCHCITVAVALHYVCSKNAAVVQRPKCRAYRTEP